MRTQLRGSILSPLIKRRTASLSSTSVHSKQPSTESGGVSLHATRLHTLFEPVPGPLCKVSRTKRNTHFIYKLLPRYHGRVHASATEPVGCVASQVHYSTGRLQVGRYARTHVLKIKRHLVQPCVDFDAIRGPFKGLWWVDFNALVRGGSMTIGSRVTLQRQVHTRVTSKISRNIRLVIPNTSSQAV